MRCLLVTLLLSLLMLTGCGSGGPPTRHNDFIPLTSIQITAVSSTIAAKTSTKLTVTGNYSGLFTRDITDQATWTSASPAVAGFVTQSVPSRVTAAAPGTATLTATVAGVSNTFNLTVSPATITSLAIIPAAPSVAKGLTAQFAVHGTFSDATVQDVTFDATWTSSDPAVATVSDVVGNKGFTQALAVGTSTVTAAFDTASTSTLLTVTSATLQSIAVSPPTSSILNLSSTGFKAIGTYSDSSTVDITSQVVWSSSQPAFATIAAGGTATALGQGTTSISASLNGISAATNLKVTGGNLVSIALSADKITPVNGAITLIKGTAARISAVGTFSNGSARDITGLVTWTSSDPTFATVSAPGGNQALLTALDITTLTTITAKSGLVAGAGNLAVIAPALQSIAFTPASLSLTAGTSSRFSAIGTFAGGITQDITVNAVWQSSDTGVATVSDLGLNKGRVSGVASGPATITATFGGQPAAAAATVTQRTLSSLTIIAGSASFVSGNQVKLAATANYSDGFSQDVTENVVWSIDKPNVAILADSTNQPGHIVAVDSGSATISASFGGKSQTVIISVP